LVRDRQLDGNINYGDFPPEVVRVNNPNAIKNYDRLRDPFLIIIPTLVPVSVLVLVFVSDPGFASVLFFL